MRNGWVLCAALLVLLLRAAPSVAQVAAAMPPDLHHGASGLLHGIPNFCALDPNTVTVPAGQTFRLGGPQAPISTLCQSAGSTVEILSGAQAKIGTWLIDGGTVVGQNLIDVQIVIANRPIDLATDPERWGTGILCISCVWHVSGLPLTTRAQQIADIPQGATTFQIDQTPLRWRAGQVLNLTHPYELVTIASVTGAAVTLTAPTRFAHLRYQIEAVTANGITAPALEMYPYLANESRTVTIQSEDPAGTRGCSLFSQRADVDERYVARVNMGRTLATQRLDNTTFDSDGHVVHVGTNPKACYSIHFHHVFGPLPNTGHPYQFQVTGDAISGDSKWGVAVHNSHFGLLQDNVIVRGTGAGIATEDGGETGISLIGNFIVEMRNPAFLATRGADETFYEPQGRAGSCVWNHSLNVLMRDNVCVGFDHEGYAFYTGCSEDIIPCTPNALVPIPKFPGADTTDPLQLAPCKGGDASLAPCVVKSLPGLTVDNNVAAEGPIGLGMWWVMWARSSPTMTRWRMWNVETCISANYSDPAIRDLTCIGSGTGDAIQQFNPAQGAGCSTVATMPDCTGVVVFASITDATLRNFTHVWRRNGQLAQAAGWTIQRAVVQTTNGVVLSNLGEESAGAIDWTSPVRVERPKFTLADVRFVPMPGQPLKTIQMVFSPPEAGTPRREFDVRVADYQGVPGQQFRVWFTQTDPNGQTGPAAPCVTTRPEIVGFVCPIDAVPVPPIVVPVHCVVSAFGAFSSWMPASAVLEQRTRTRTVITPASNGGSACPPLIEMETRPVITVTCPYMAPGATAVQQRPFGDVIMGVNQIATQATRWPLLLSWGWKITAEPVTKTTVNIIATCVGPK